MPAWLATVKTDLIALVAAWISLRGGWRTAWRDAVQLLSHRRIVVDTRAETEDGPQVVLRTRVRLTGDVQTDVLRCWLDGAPRPAAEALLTTHFRSVGDAARGWGAVAAGIRLASLAISAAGLVPASAFTIQLALQAQWNTLFSALLTDWRVLSGIVVVGIGWLLRQLLRWLLRRKFRAGLSGAGAIE